MALAKTDARWEFLAQNWLATDHGRTSFLSDADVASLLIGIAVHHM